MVCPPTLRFLLRPAFHRQIHLFFIFVHASGPVMIFFHGVDLHLSEHRLVMVEHPNCLAKSLLQRVLREPGEGETSRRVLVSSFIPKSAHRVLQATCFMDYGQGAVHLRIHLRQTTRLVLRRHQEQIAPSQHAMLYTRIKTNIATNLSTIHGFHLCHFSCPLVFTLPHDDELGSSSLKVMEQPRDDRHEERQAFLIAEPATEAQKDHVWINVEAKLLLQGFLVGSLSFLEVCDAEVLCNVRVDGWTPLVRNAVEDSNQPLLSPPSPEIVVDAIATLGALYFVCVVRGDGQNTIGSSDATKKKIDAVVTEMHIFALQILTCKSAWQVEEGINWVFLFGVLALVSDVVDHHHAAHVVVDVVCLVLVEEVHRENACLPVIANEEHVLTVG
mmetsp:Transcript_24863/g.45027  ORF Transcript_24863/g.45027 Transcript_24863/m.45027 type:complete len:387 (-) Transcript_24863:1255-2415(-)